MTREMAQRAVHSHNYSKSSSRGGRAAPSQWGQHSTAAGGRDPASPGWRVQASQCGCVGHTHIHTVSEVLNAYGLLCFPSGHWFAFLQLMKVRLFKNVRKAPPIPMGFVNAK